ncbi:hypothetical protein [Paludisphaera soli]|uniref:hypothetical protein n=1 Tax=Paludisphaera soli TaxID=2712865 RepID=UPI0013ED7B25|nr:hypothetical protein [Paludisphaera soli]
MDGLLLKLLEDHTGRAGFWFVKLFRPIRQDLDRLAWCFEGPPWMGALSGFDYSVFLRPEDGDDNAYLWRPGSLFRYADRFVEQDICLWAIEPTREDPLRVASLYHKASWKTCDDVIREHARVWLIYTDSSCWEIYSRKPGLLDRVREGLDGKPSVEVYQARDDRRREAYRTAGLGRIWDNFHPSR